LAAREDGQEAHPHRACTDWINRTNQAPAAFERRLFWLLFVPLQKVTPPDAVRIQATDGPPVEATAIIKKWPQRHRDTEEEMVNGNG